MLNNQNLNANLLQENIIIKILLIILFDYKECIKNDTYEVNMNFW